MNPKVSVIIPAYNTETYIGKAIESALEQTLTDIEVIIVDDGSSDKTVEVAKSFTDQRLKVIVNQQNLGAAAARNRAFRVAQGEWIAVLDSDDWYAPERLEKLVSLANKTNADMIADDVFFIKDGTTSPWSTLIQESGERIDKIFQIDIVYFVETDVFGEPGLHLGLSKPLFKREFLVKHGIEYDDEIRMGQDFWLDMKCLIKGARFFIEPKPYYFYRSRPGSLVYQSQLPRLNQSCKAATYFMQQDIVKKNPALMRALSYNLSVYKKNLAYLQVVEPIKQGKWLTAFTQIRKYPGFFYDFMSRLNSIVERRIQYYLMNNKSSFDIYPNQQKKRKTIT
ncbi:MULTISPECIES: glycosyltransferase family 2 protein [unclassified Nostoc]|uniref:glycosyltransferase family 2 protein n=1 Tax=unclassified Nostoc TaxID=2593658 RepID=UPI0025AA8BC6|nr:MULTISPECIES: glycosyltransferase family 2 protein [unclassified Nostoc]MDM9585919.1 glycosyltransferase family 2 protein [Nostoc sp. GT001]MDZ7945493.1 glycosyltransferase family 2 protein [Nostoc sp. EfeVER01]MDZ7994429.1 glycosyltransferase family 2 protein [Nostoc sp. EspVER01]